MTLIIKKKGVRDNRVIEYDKKAVALGMNLAKKQQEYERLQKEVSFLTSFKARVVKGVIYNEKGELRKLDGSFKDYEALSTMVEELKKSAGELTQKKQDLERSVAPLQEKYDQIIADGEAKVTSLNNKKIQIENKISVLNESIESSEKRLNDLNISVQREKENLEDTKKKIDQEMRKIDQRESELNDREEMMVRKTRDLLVYERRIRRAFERQFPGQKMRLADEPLE